MQPKIIRGDVAGLSYLAATLAALHKQKLNGAQKNRGASAHPFTLFKCFSVMVTHHNGVALLFTRRTTVQSLPV